MGDIRFHGDLVMAGTKRILAGILAVCVLLVACGRSSESSAVTAVAPTLAEPAEAGQISMGGSALGGNAQTTVLAQLKLDVVPAGPLGWVTHRLELAPGEMTTHPHQTAFVYAGNGSHELDGQSLLQGQGAAVQSDIEHRHRAIDGPSTFWETRLDRPDRLRLALMQRLSSKARSWRTSRTVHWRCSFWW